MAEQPGKASAKYKVIAAALRARIERGEWLAGAQLPTEADLVTEYGAAGGTISKALKLLGSLGMTETLQGSGTFVLSQQATEELEPATVRMLASKLEDVLQRLGKVEQRLDDALGPDAR